ncbi:MAG: nucleoside:proton symporter, partial [Candidatus Accumulibacter sp.]|nr:nucleoside:proton symporter [Accumulibacter sp.]
MPYLQSLLGIVFAVALVWLMSENRRAVTPRLVLGGLAFQFVLAALLLKLPWIAAQAGTLNNFVTALEEATLAGTSFVFGYVGGGPAPFEVTNANAMVIFA